ncbi:hypothetical protein D3C73_973830 [compost metagenome]
MPWLLFLCYKARAISVAESCSKGSCDMMVNIFALAELDIAFTTVKVFLRSVCSILSMSCAAAAGGICV